MLENLGDRDLRDLTMLSTSNSFGPETGLSHSGLYLASVSHSLVAFQLRRHVSDPPLLRFNSVRPGTAFVFHNMVVGETSTSQEIIKRLRSRFLPDQFFSMYAVFARVLLGEVSLRECQAKCVGQIWR